jgi:hypothetical protein
MALFKLDFRLFLLSVEVWKVLVVICSGVVLHKFPFDINLPVLHG